MEPGYDIIGNKETVDLMNGVTAMDDTKQIQENVEDIPEDKKGVLAWIRDHKTELLFAGVSVTVLLAAVLGLKHKDDITELLESLKEQLEKGSLYSEKWFKKASLEELEEARAVVQKDYRNPELDMDYRSHCWNLLSRFDQAIGDRKWQGKEYRGPAHSPHGWYLPSDD